MAARSKIQTDTLARILSDQGHIAAAQTMLQHLQQQRPTAERDAAIAAMGDRDRQVKLERLEGLLERIRTRKQ
jgi:hypothetical protein